MPSPPPAPARRRRPWLAAVVALLAIPLAAAAALVGLVDPNDYKQQVVDAVQHATGRALRINGALSVSRSLWPVITAEGVELANLPGGSRADMARAERITAQLSLPALLWRRVEVLKLGLVGPNILLEQVAGAPNWTFDLPAGEAAAADAAPFALSIGEVAVQNGMVTSRLPARTRVVGIRSLNLRHRAEGGPLNLAARLVYADNQPFDLRLTAQPTNGVDDPWTLQMELAAFDTSVSATGWATLAGRYSLALDGRSGALEKLNALLPEMRLPALRQAVLATNLTNGPVPGDIPVIGATRLRLESAELGAILPGLALGATEIALPAAGGIATASGQGRYAGQGFGFAGSFTLPLQLDGRAELAHEVTLTTQPAAATLGLKGSLALDTLQFAGLDSQLAFRAPALAALRPLLGPALPALGDVRLEGRLRISSRDGALRLDRARLTAREGEVSGEASLAGTAIAARLRSSRLDLDALLAGLELPAAAPRPADGMVIPDIALPWGLLRGPRLDIAGAFAGLTYAGESWPPVDGSLRLAEGVLQEARARLDLPGGPAELTLSTAAAGPAPPLRLNLAAPTLPLALLARQLGLPGPVEGSAKVEARLQAAGASLRALAATLDGSLAISAVDGRIANAAFIRLTAASLDALGIQVPPQGETALRCFALVGNFAKGVGQLATIALETTYLSLTGGGRVDLGREALALRLEPMARVAGSDVAVPVVVEGPFRAIAGRLDADGMDKLGFLLNGMFGGDTSRACVKAGLAPR